MKITPSESEVLTIRVDRKDDSEVDEYTVIPGDTFDLQTISIGDVTQGLTEIMIQVGKHES